VTSILGEAGSVVEATPHVLAAIGDTLGWEMGAIWGVDRQANRVRCIATWHAADRTFPRFEAMTREHVFAPGQGLPGRVWAAGAAVWIPDVATDPNFPRATVAAAEGLHAAVGFPIRLGEQILGVIEFFSREIRAPDEPVIRLMATVGSQMGQFIERKRAEDEREQLLAREQAARAEAEAANRAKDEFLAMVSHELRTPLGAMILWLRMLRTKTLDEAKVANALEKLERAAHAQTRLIEDLLDISRMITGKLRLSTRAVDLAVVLDAALDAINPAADAKGIRIVRTIDAALGAVSGDPDRLQQVLANLLSNAVKFTAQGGCIEVRLERDGPHARIAVRDTGVGIEADLLPHVFERFRQGDGSRTHAGLGLGLALVRHLVELHGGTVSAESGGTDQGATFVVRLPIPALRLKAPSRPDVPAPLDEPPTPSLQGLQVLVVDDDADAREVMTAVLESRAAAVTVAASASEALALLDREAFDVLLCDIAMPGEDGYSLMRRLRAREATHGGRVPAAALTAFARPEDRARAFLAGFQAHLAKPVEPTDLIAAVATLATQARPHTA
jgi:signal transduction histidine kinase/CheY-like chemotaxis protein